MRRIWPLLVCLLATSGCGGYYILTVPDHLAPAGDETAVVVRLQRNDFFILAMPVKGAVMRFQVGGDQQRAAYTDDLGYAGATLQAPDESGRYLMRVSHLDREGEEVYAEVLVYAWRANRPVIAVDLDGLPRAAGGKLWDARDALKRLNRGANLIYFTRKDVKDHDKAHRMLAAAGFPDGPVLLWRRKRWHIVRGRWKMPKVVVESRLVSQLAEIRGLFPALNKGVCNSEIAAKAFAAAGLKPVVIGKANVNLPEVTRFSSWSLLAKQGLCDSASQPAQ
ncbi:MAG: hypothetical protein SVT52_00620 [Planctomycetota bacterium]|nr:hypothetical protein [Planctomycetota bacterium]